MEATHVSVMKDEVLAALMIKPGSVAVDGTLGLAGHGSAMAEQTAPGGLFIGFDWDQQMLARAEEKLSAISDVEVRLFHADYRELPERVREVCRETGRLPYADAILLDLGLNNAQIEDTERGISFRNEGPLDMRMDRSQGEPASALLNRIGPAELEQILWDFGDERWARRIAKVVVERRKSQPLKTTADLVDCVMAAIPAAKRDQRLHPATRTFQAIRIYLNGELDGLEECLIEIGQVLNEEGVLVVLSYHSGEDRAVKQAFKYLADTNDFDNLTRKPILPSEAEVAANGKARSAKMRVLKRKHITENT